MNKETKTSIVDAAKAYMAQHDFSQNKLAEAAGINISYLSSMMAGQTAITVKDRPVAIADKWYAMLATSIGYSYQKQYWPFVPTDEFKQIITVLDFAKEHAFTNIIICHTGLGKTHAIELFSKKHPAGTYVVTVGRLTKLSDILNDIADCLGLPQVHINSTKLKKITAKLRDLHFSDANPVLIIDEAENLSLPVLQMLKALYDQIKQYSGVVLIGTEQLTDKLERMESRNVEGMPQFCRRFRAGRRVIHVANNFAPFFEKLGIADKKLIQLLTRLARNYGELRDYLEPALREADRLDQPLTETLFRQFHYLGNH